jgi:hypothetical protein
LVISLMPPKDLEDPPRFASPIEDGTRRPDPLLCRYLRTKTWYVPDSYAERDVSRSSSTAQYWCLKTMRSDGPDGALALAEDCVEGRGCFERAAGKSESG